MKPTIDAILEKCAFSEQKVWRDCGYDDESEPGVKQIIGGGKAVHLDLMPIIRELCSEIERLKLKIGALDLTLNAIDDHIRKMRVDGIIDMKQMIAALKVISDGIK